jgi:3-phenylpropionate/trans-cinnamate dioxygenase ferredoxin subunit
VKVNKTDTAQKINSMSWVKIFANRNEALIRLAEHKPQVVVIGEKRICLVRDENRFFAVSNSCTHNGESLHKGAVNFVGEIVCPWHGFQFNLKTGREYKERSPDLEIFPVRDEEDGLYIAI